jgi:hypothetical protein
MVQGEEMRVLKEEDPAVGQVEITFEGKKFNLLAYKPDSCMGCGKSVTGEDVSLEAPSLGVRVYVLGDIQDKRGWVEYGNSVVEGIGGKGITLLNQFYATENIRENVEVGTFDAKVTGNYSLAKRVDIDEEELQQVAIKEAEAWSEVNYMDLGRGRKISNVMEPVIGYGIYVIPRSYFFLPGYRPIKFDFDWLECIISYSFKLHRIEPLEKGQVPECWDGFRDSVVAFAHGLTFFITRFIYQPDRYAASNSGGDEPPVELEIYSKDVMLLGAGDCEDVAYLLQQMCLAIKQNPDLNSGVLGYCRRLLQYYIPVHCLVQAVAPKMPVKVSGKSEMPPSDLSVETLHDAQKSMVHYHVVCILMPARDIVKFFARAKADTMQDHDTRKAKYRELKQEYYKTLNVPGHVEEGGGEFKDLPKHSEINRIILEGTSSIHACHLHKLLLTPAQVSCVGQAVEADFEPIKAYTFLNFEGGSIMYGAGIQFASQEFIPIADTPLATVAVEIDGKNYGGPMEYMFSFENYAKKIKLIPGPSTPVKTPIPRWYDPPAPVLTVSNKNEFLREVKALPPLIRTLAEPLLGYWTSKQTQIPYLPWNEANPGEKIYLSSLESM